MAPGLVVTLPQSHANTPDRDLLQRLCAPVEKLTRLDCVHRFTGGYSACRVYLAVAEFQGAPAVRPWIVKLGPLSELKPEDDALALTKAQVAPEHVASKVYFLVANDTAALILDVANYDGRPPIDLEAILARVEAPDAINAICDVIDGWIGNPTWKTSNLSQIVKSWTISKLPNLPPEVLKSAAFPIIYSPDLGEAYSNPLYHLIRDLKRKDVRSPFAFTHGDLNARNVLFARAADGTIELATPTFIDFRHAGHDQFAIVDLAKLESTLRHLNLPACSDLATLTQNIAFLSATRKQLQTATLPDSCTDKRLQDLWRGIRIIRASVQKLFSRAPAPRDPHTEATYWATLMSYALSTATYPQLALDARTLAYLEAAALFTEHFLPRTPGNQFVLPAHSGYSPPVVTAVSTPTSPSQLALLLKAIADSQAVLMIGPGYGRTSGVEPFLGFLQRLFKELTTQPTPAVSSSILLEGLQKKKRRQDILRAIRERTSKWDDTDDRAFASLPWALVLQYHFHALPFAALTTGQGQEPLRIDSHEAAVSAVDQIASGRRAYVPLHGDIEGLPDSLVLTSSDRKDRDHRLTLIARGLEQRQASLALVFWKCDDLTVDEIASMRSLLAADMTVGVDAYYISTLEDNARDASLDLLDIHRVALDMTGVLAAAAAAPEATRKDEHSTRWNHGSESYALPNLLQQSRGLLRLYDGSLAIIDESRSAEAFLLGAAATSHDVTDGRVVQRVELEGALLPAIRDALIERDKEPNIVVVKGRAGSGISTLLCHSAVILDRDGVGPIIIADTRVPRGRKEWRAAGELIAEVSHITSSTVVLFAEATDRILDGVLALISGVLEKRGRIVVVVGGRRESLLQDLPTDAKMSYFHVVEVGDRLARNEWMALARILRRYGFRSEMSADELATRMGSVGRLLPALYEATDRKNRKFREIVAHEYDLYKRDHLLQHAYRLICTLGAFDVAISQYWLLKALGNRGMSEAARILGALSEDIVVHRDEFARSGDIVIEPLHRIIAEEVVNVASPDPLERFKDIERLIATANLASEGQGLAVAALLYKDGPLIRWSRSAIQNDQQRKELVRTLFETALANEPLHPQVEIHIRQHFALVLRLWGALDEALNNITLAWGIESDNPATAHILGLVHETRAVNAWRDYVASGDDRLLARARSNEHDALEFFRNVRDATPMREHGYESEARYYKRKRETLGNAHGASGLVDEARLQVFQGLYLLRTAEARVPKADLKESPRTKSNLLNLAGDLDAAIEALVTELKASNDPVRNLRFLRATLTLTVEAERWDESLRYADKLLAAGERDAALFLTRDECAHHAGWSAAQRITALRDSVEQYNRWDIETLVRWAELALAEGYFERAADALNRADEVARQDLGIMERERIRGTLKDKNELRRFEGKVTRLMRRDEGHVAVKGLSRDLYFRVGPDLRGQFKVGDKISFGIAWRIRGLRGIDVKKA